MCIAQVSTAIEAFCHSIAVARIADGVLNIRYFDNSALHAWNFISTCEVREGEEKAHTCVIA